MDQLGDIVEIESSPNRLRRERQIDLNLFLQSLKSPESEADEGKAFTSRRVGPSHLNSHAGLGPSSSSPKRTYRI
jgi:hypothetical protein